MQSKYWENINYCKAIHWVLNQVGQLLPVESMGLLENKAEIDINSCTHFANKPRNHKKGQLVDIQMQVTCQTFHHN